MRQAQGKLVPLEGLRGIAAAIVVIYHLVLAYTPHGAGTVPHGHGPFDVMLQFILGMLNGGAAVSVFFVLSGFILSLPFARDRRMSRVLVAVLKRWPRLAALTLIACLFAFALIQWSGHDYKQAADVIGAKWLASHGNSPIVIHKLTWGDAIRDGLVSVFSSGDVHFDSPLWTMRIELFASFAIFLAAPVLFAIRNWPLRIALVAGGMLLAGTHYPYTFFSDFLVGCVLAMLFAEQKFPDFANGQALLVGLLGIYCFSFTYEQKLLIHAPLKAVLPGGASHFVWDVGAACLILVLLGNPYLRRVFSHGWAVWMGMLSFPIYLLHGPILLSIGASSFVRTESVIGPGYSALSAACLSIVVTLLCALPLAWVDKIWTGALGRAGRVICPPRQPAKRRIPPVLDMQPALVPVRDRRS